MAQSGLDEYSVPTNSVPDQTASDDMDTELDCAQSRLDPTAKRIEPSQKKAEELNNNQAVHTAPEFEACPVAISGPASKVICANVSATAPCS